MNPRPGFLTLIGCANEATSFPSRLTLRGHNATLAQPTATVAGVQQIRDVRHDPAVGQAPEMTHEEVDAVVRRHVGRIAQAVPEGVISLSGSTLLGHYGGHDIDLVVLVPHVADAAGRLGLLYPPLYQ